MMKQMYCAPETRIWLAFYEQNVLYSGLKDMTDTTVYTEDLDDDD